jgi:hypothetical protein
MSQDSWFFIEDFDGFVNNARSLVFKFFGQNEEINSDDFGISGTELSKEEFKELNETLTFEESSAIIRNHAKSQIHRKTKAVRYCINDSILMKIIEDLNSRLVSNILNSLVNKGVLESAYDSDENDFVFWIKESLDDKKHDTDNRDQS